MKMFATSMPSVGGESVRLCPVVSGCFSQSRTAAKLEQVRCCGHLSGLSGRISIASRMRARARGYNHHGSKVIYCLGILFLTGQAGQIKEVLRSAALFVSGCLEIIRTEPDRAGQRGW